jgi:hypothetical protein
MTTRSGTTMHPMTAAQLRYTMQARYIPDADDGTLDRMVDKAA